MKKIWIASMHLKAVAICVAQHAPQTAGWMMDRTDPKDSDARHCLCKTGLKRERRFCPCIFGIGLCSVLVCRD